MIVPLEKSQPISPVMRPASATDVPRIKSSKSVLRWYHEVIMHGWKSFSLTAFVCAKHFNCAIVSKRFVGECYHLNPVVSVDL